MKPFGFPIHGAVDGFSRKVIWLKVARTNNHPIVPAYFYLESVQKLKKAPSHLRTDCGTETGIMAAIHCALHQDVNAHTYGKSVTNQRIENWWSHYRRGYTSWLIDFFKQLVDDGIFTLGHNVHMECAWFVFSKLLQSELDEVASRWNSHFIRKSHCSSNAGIPDELYYLPEKRGFKDCGLPITKSDLQHIIQQRNITEEAAVYCGQ